MRNVIVFNSVEKVDSTGISEHLNLEVENGGPT